MLCSVCVSRIFFLSLEARGGLGLGSGVWMGNVWGGCWKGSGAGWGVVGSGFLGIDGWVIRGFTW